MMPRSISTQIVALAFGASALITWAAQPFPGHNPDRRTIEIQNKVDSLFEAGDYGRAMIIYRDELAPLGDKYAQYMIGYMYLAGKGVAKDLPMAAAWYRLAAERQQETFVRESQKLTRLMTAQQLEQADGIFVELRARLGDAVLINRLIEEDLETLQADAGSTSASFRGVDTSARIQRISRDRREVQLASRIDYVRTMLSVDGWAGAESRRRFRELESRAERVLRVAE
jgi:hypothetical protein